MGGFPKIVYGISMAGDGNNPCLPNFELKIESKLETKPEIIIKKGLGEKNMVNKTEIRAFLHDAKAVSPAIATLILIVIAAVAAAGVGILVQSSQKNAQDQTANKDLSVMGTLNIKGSTTILPVTQAAAEAFMKKYTAITISPSGGGSDYGQLIAYTTTSPLNDVGASSSQWSTSTKTINGITLPARKDIIIQEAGADAKVFETKIGTGMIVLASQDQINVDATNFSLLRTAYSGSGSVTMGGKSYKVVQRSDMSGTEETFAKWIGLADTNGQLITNTNVIGSCA